MERSLKLPLPLAKTPDLSPQDLLACLRLSRSENVGPVSFFQLLSLYKTAEAALEALPEWARRGGRTQHLHLCSRSEAEHELEALTKFGGHLISFYHEQYPEILKSLHDAPPLLSVKGRTQLLSSPKIAVVGARNASLNGKKLAGAYAKEIGAQGYVVVSGMARGIDTAAHEGSLSSGTLAVLAGGLDHIYPPENKKLYEEIGEKGLLLTEAAFGRIPQASSFPRRNRLVSGLSLGVVIVEAALKSGSLITARFALEQGREVFAVPGSPLDPRCHGTNRLIQQGAALVQTAQDILHGLEKPLRDFYRAPSPDIFHPLEEMSSQELAQTLEKARHIILENLSFTPIQVDELIRECHFPSTVVMIVLLELELAGRLLRYPGNQVSLRAEL